MFCCCFSDLNKMVLTGIPGVPLNPGTPCSPRYPLNPLDPNSPGNPFSPLGPQGPSGPISPGTPSGPLKPGSPGSPEIPFSPLQMHLWDVAHPLHGQFYNRINYCDMFAMSMWSISDMINKPNSVKIWKYFELTSRSISPETESKTWASVSIIRQKIQNFGVYLKSGGILKQYNPTQTFNNHCNFMIILELRLCFLLHVSCKDYLLKPIQL